jgi:hypothetical protein
MEPEFAAQVHVPTDLDANQIRAFRPGAMNHSQWATTRRIAALMGAIRIAHQGTQSHRFARAEFAENHCRQIDYFSQQGYSREGPS